LVEQENKSANKQVARNTRVLMFVNLNIKRSTLL
jgi:hypothetical protein